MKILIMAVIMSAGAMASMPPESKTKNKIKQHSGLHEQQAIVDPDDKKPSVPPTPLLSPALLKQYESENQVAQRNPRILAHNTASAETNFPNSPRGISAESVVDLNQFLLTPPTSAHESVSDEEAEEFLGGDDEQREVELDKEDKM